MKNEFNEKESLMLIREMIDNSRARMGNGSFFFLLWGWLVLFASLANFILACKHYLYSYVPWLVIIVVGVIVSGIAAYRMKKRKRVKTFLDVTMSYLWLSFTITLMFILFCAGFGKISWEMSDILIIALYGLSTFTTGGIIKFTPLMVGGIASWIIAAVSLFISPHYILLSVALAIIVAYLIPGYMLRIKEKPSNHV